MNLVLRIAEEKDGMIRHVDQIVPLEMIDQTQCPEYALWTIVKNMKRKMAEDDEDVKTKRLK